MSGHRILSQYLFSGVDPRCHGVVHIVVFEHPCTAYGAKVLKAPYISQNLLKVGHVFQIKNRVGIHQPYHMAVNDLIPLDKTEFFQITYR